MRIDVHHRPAYAMAEVHLDAGETVVAEGGSMVSMDSHVTMDTSAGKKDEGLFVMEDDLILRGIAKSETSASVIDYGILVDMMVKTDKVIGLF